MLKHKLILFFLLSCFTVTLKAQDIYFSNYPQQQFFYNPAFAGVDSTHDFSLSGRTQFGSISAYGKYYDAVISYNQPICNSKSGIGGIVAYQQNSSSQRYQLALAYNYKFKLAEKMNLRIGASAIQEFYHQDETQNWWSGTNPAFDKTFFDLSAGFEYDWQNFFLGFSIKHILKQKESYNMNIVYAAKFFTSGYKINFCKSFSTTPSIFYVLQGPAQEFQVANDMCFKKIFLLGCGAIYNEAVSIRGGICLKNKFQEMVSYDITTSTLARPTNNQGAFEANIQYRF